MRKPKYEVYQDGSGEWRWRLRAANGKVVADSAEGYTERGDALEGIQRVRDMAFAAGVEFA